MKFLFLCLSTKPRRPIGVVKVKLHAFLSGVVSFMLRPLFPLERSPDTRCIGQWANPPSFWTRWRGAEELLVRCPKSNPHRQVRRPSREWIYCRCLNHKNPFVSYLQGTCEGAYSAPSISQCFEANRDDRWDGPLWRHLRSAGHFFPDGITRK